MVRNFRVALVAIHLRKGDGFSLKEKAEMSRVGIGFKSGSLCGRWYSVPFCALPCSPQR